MAACIYLFGTIVYILFARGEEQAWSRGTDKEDLAAKGNKNESITKKSEENNQIKKCFMYGSVSVHGSVGKDKNEIHIVA